MVVMVVMMMMMMMMMKRIWVWDTGNVASSFCSHASRLTIATVPADETVEPKDLVLLLPLLVTSIKSSERKENRDWNLLPFAIAPRKGSGWKQSDCLPKKNKKRGVLKIHCDWLVQTSLRQQVGNYAKSFAGKPRAAARKSPVNMAKSCNSVERRIFLGDGCKNVSKQEPFQPPIITAASNTQPGKTMSKSDWKTNLRWVLSQSSNPSISLSFISNR